MCTKKILLVLVFYIPLIIPSHVSAWDDQRRGFLLGLGAGATINKTTSTAGNTSEIKQYNGMNVDLKLGYATSNTFQLYLYENISIFNETYMDTIAQFTIIPLTTERVVEKELVHFGIGMGARYYLYEAAPSPFFDAGFGFCHFGDPVFQDGRWGAAYVFGGGFEFNPHWDFKLVLLGSTSKYEDYLFTGKKSSIFSFIFTLNVLGY